jgi:hypothetical protein
VAGRADKQNGSAPRHAGIFAPGAGIMDIWKSFSYPRLLCAEGQSTWVRVPFQADNREWLREDAKGETHGRRQPKWNRSQERWEVPQNWRGEVTRKCVERYGGVVVISEGKSEVDKCAPACWDAVSDVTECTCSCGGWWHGKHNPGGFYVIGDALAVRWRGADLQAVFFTAEGSKVLASAGADS